MTTFRHLKIFITVAECGTMRKAAEVLYISQPSVSQAISELEELYQVRLFDRLSRRIYITEAGRLLLSYARQVIKTTESMEESMQRAGTMPIVRIGGSVTVGTVYLGGLTKRLEEAVPGIDIRITVDNTASVERQVLTSELDLAVVEGMLSSEDLIRRTVCDDELVMVAGRDHPLSAARSLTLEDLQGQALISREAGSSERNQFEQLMADRNIRMTKKWHCTNTEAIKTAVIEGMGIAILSRRLITREVAADLLRVLPLDPVSVRRSFKLIVHKDKVLPQAVRAFLESEVLPEEPPAT